MPQPARCMLAVLAVQNLRTTLALGSVACLCRKGTPPGTLANRKFATSPLSMRGGGRGGRAKTRFLSVYPQFHLKSSTVLDS